MLLDYQNTNIYIIMIVLNNRIVSLKTVFKLYYFRAQKYHRLWRSKSLYEKKEIQSAKKRYNAFSLNF